MSQVRISWQPVKRRYGEELDDVRQETTRLREALERTAPLSPPLREKRHGNKMAGTAPADDAAAPYEAGGSRGAAGRGKKAAGGGQKGKRKPPLPVDPSLASTMPSDGEGLLGGPESSDEEEDEDEDAVLAGLDELKATRREVT